MDWGLIGLGVNIVGGLIGGNKSSQAARQQAQSQNQATEAQYKYDLELHQMTQDKIITDREEAIEAIEVRAENERKRAAYLDANAAVKYNYDMMIRNREQTSLNQQFLRSRDIYGVQTGLNEISEKQATENELRKYQEINAEAAFDLQDQRIERLQAEGKFRAKGITGRSAGKVQQVTGADFGRMVAQINEATSAAGRNTKAVLKEIQADKISADLSAEAARMLDPGVLPEPVVPFATPMAEYVLPRELEAFDFGPKPIRGAMASPSAASNRVWGQTISSVAGSLGSGLMGLAGTSSSSDPWAW